MTEYKQLVPMDVLKLSAITLSSPPGERDIQWLVKYILRFPQFQYISYHPNGDITAILLGRDEVLRDREVKLIFEVDDDDRNAYIQRIYTMPRYRRVCMASKLLKLFEQFGKSQELICADCLINDSCSAGIQFLKHHEYAPYDSLLVLGQTGYRKILLNIDNSANTQGLSQA